MSVARLDLSLRRASRLPARTRLPGDETGLLPCPSCSVLAEPHHAECVACAEPLFKTGCAACGVQLFAGHAFCVACGEPTAPPGERRERPATWAEGTPPPQDTARFARLGAASEAETFDGDDDAPTAARQIASGPHRRFAVRPSRGPCPRCQGPLVQRGLGAVDLDECHRCGGLFLDPVELTRMVFGRAIAASVVPGLLSRASTRPSIGGTLHGCPVCRRRLSIRALATPAGRTAVCRLHGAWFEPAGLAAAARELADGAITIEDHVFDDDVRKGRFEALLAHARALRGRVPGRHGPLSLLAELLA